jgi:hypothetical protein
MRTARIVSASVVATAVFTLAALAPACGGSGTTGFGNPVSGNGSGGGQSSSGGGSGGLSSGGGSGSGGLPLPPGGDGGGGGPTTSSCPGGGSTTISGTVYDPAKKNPLYDVVVYVPGGAPSALTPGASCDSCNSLYTGNPVASALTDTAGKFQIQNAPSGSNVPLVIQIGKWRKQLTIPTVKSCTDNPQPDKSLSLPTKGSEGDIPNIAVSTGGADSLECLLSRVGLDQSEYTGGPGGTGHIHIFEGGGGGGGPGGLLGVPTMNPAAASSASLWDSQADLMKYDIVLLSCEGAETTAMNQAALDSYTKAGGRVFASHFHYAWFNTGPFAAYNLAAWTTGATPIMPTGGTGLGTTIDAVIDQTLPGGAVFPKGQALDKWLGTVGALETTGKVGDLPIAQAKHNVDLSASNVNSQSWIHADTDTDSPGATEYFSFNTPVNAPVGDAGPEYCGRVVFSDLHVGGAGGFGASDYVAGVLGGMKTVPTGCANADLSPQEKALEFMLFDLSSCVIPDNLPPGPPPVNPPK